MSVLCFGGSFNPVHHGHLICARAVAETRGIERVVLIPSFLPPHKPDSADLAASGDRLEMCRLASKLDPLFDTSGIEISRGGPSFTIDTVRELKRLGWNRVQWLIGADMLLYLPKWHQPLELLREIDFLVMARPGWEMDWDRLPAEFRPLKANVVPAPLIDISSSDIRRRVAAGQSINYLTPPAVCEYIRERSLYR